MDLFFRLPPTVRTQLFHLNAQTFYDEALRDIQRELARRGPAATILLPIILKRHDGPAEKIIKDTVRVIEQMSDDEERGRAKEELSRIMINSVENIFRTRYSGRAEEFIEEALSVIEQMSNYEERGHAKEELSRIMINSLPTNAVPLVKILNPFVGWRREPNRNIFTRGHKIQRIPNGKFNPALKNNIAYVVKGYEDSGSYGEVFTFVVYQNQVAVIKFMADLGCDFFELVTQAYMYETCRKFPRIQVPRLLFLQKSNGKTCACMTAAKGIALKNCKAGTDMRIALAHAMRALYELQRDCQFMHRDLSGSNIFFDKKTKEITFIDFGMSCVNPENADNAWQRDDDYYFEEHPDSNASKCSNRSLDASILISWLSVRDDWCDEQQVQMKRDYTEAIKASSNVRAKEKLAPSQKRHTVIRSHDWRVGNGLKRTDGHHWWLYEMIEFPVPRWYPENVLTRILRTLPVEHWFDIRNGWSTPFDAIMPKDSTFTFANGQTGIIKSILSRPKRCRVLVGGNMVDVFLEDSSGPDAMPKNSARHAQQIAKPLKQRARAKQQKKDMSQRVLNRKYLSKRPFGNIGSARHAQKIVKPLQQRAHAKQQKKDMSQRVEIRKRLSKRPFGNVSSVGRKLKH